ncbi:hypothetical protein AJ79_07125 [Helicocarpus griseus UAMH5409]|uniref:Protein PBN1 n=1 Tax=Helicocarpus griseus UAMH5409 TaxID=1447875 RepID=A0A2B7WYB3_9EURO|nr:hypothetical protein AJ79_07125 [Helicocarpus griseus UAMH5409]
MRIASVYLNAFALFASLHETVGKQIPERPLIHQSTSFHDNIRRDAFDLVPAGHDLEKRVPSPQQDAPSQSTAGQSQPAETGGTTSLPAFDEQQFNSTATTACLDALDDLEIVVNPSGMAACFNIPVFDNSTGAFEADIRLYQVSDAVGEFAGVPPSEYTLQVNIPQATISDPRRLAGGVTDGQPGEMALLQEFRHFGQISTLLQIEKLTQDNIRVLLIPNITISASKRENQQLVTTTLSSDTLSYVIGFFSNPDNSPVNITIPEANAQLPAIVAAATEFVLPGTTLGIFPTGLIVTSAWAGIFLFAVGYGTFKRMKYRDHYRRRLKIAAARADGNRRI